MKVSQRTEYGIRAMVALAANYEAGPLSIPDIASREALPEPFLEQLMGDLRRAGLVQSTRGSRGGYRLAEEPGSVSVGSIVEVLEGSLSPARCTDACVKRKGCSTRSVLDMIEESISSTLESVRLGDLLKVGANE